MLCCGRCCAVAVANSAAAACSMAIEQEESGCPRAQQHASPCVRHVPLHTSWHLSCRQPVCLAIWHGHLKPPDLMQACAFHTQACLFPCGSLHQLQPDDRDCRGVLVGSKFTGWAITLCCKSGRCRTAIW